MEQECPADSAREARDFFSPIPRGVWELIEAKRVTRRDAAVLGVLLDYKGRGGTVVYPCQATLAARLGCSVDTVQRSVRRLVAAGLVATKRVRDAAGRVRGISYDLAAALALAPSKAAKLRRGDWGRKEMRELTFPSENNANICAPARPQKCGVSEADRFVAEADNSACAQIDPAAPEPRGVVVDFINLGIPAARAAALVSTHGEARCREALSAAAGRRTIRDRAGWVVQCLSDGWKLPKCPAGRRAGGQYRVYAFPEPPPPASPACDPLETLPPAQKAALESAARAALLAELPTLRRSLEAGRSRRVVESRMRALLESGARGGSA